MNIVVKTQAEWDALPKAFDNWTEIEIRCEAEIVIRSTPDSSTVRAYGSSTVTACGSSTVRACGSSTVRAYGSSTVTACGSSTVRAYDSSTVRAYGSSTVTACGSSTVRACGSSTVRAYGSSTVRAYGSSTVTAYDSSTVRAYDSSTVRAYDSSTVRAYGSSTVRAYGAVAVHVQSTASTILLAAFAIAIVIKKGAIKKLSKTATVIEPKKPRTTPAWIGWQGGEKTAKFVTLYKRVSSDFKTQEGTGNETHWQIGLPLTHKAWNPKGAECGGGKFHACAHPVHCDKYRDGSDDKYIALKVATADTYVWPDGEHPNKIAFRKGTVLYQCDVNGKRVAQ